jgi:hypothetical protein
MYLFSKRLNQFIKSTCMQSISYCLLTETTKFSPVIQRTQICIHVIEIISVRRVEVVIPLLGQRIFAIDSSFWFRFVVHTVKSNTSLQEYMEIRVRARVLGDFVKRLEYIYKMDDISEVSVASTAHRQSLITRDHIFKTVKL